MATPISIPPSYHDAMMRELFRLPGTASRRRQGAQQRWAMYITGVPGPVREFVARGRLKAERKARRIALRYSAYLRWGYRLVAVERSDSLPWSKGWIDPIKRESEPVLVFPRRSEAVVQPLSSGVQAITYKPVVIVADDEFDPIPADRQTMLFKTFARRLEEEIRRAIIGI